MRIWHHRLLPYLPDSQFKGQLRELVVIMRDWRDKGTTNHLLINRVMLYPKAELTLYFTLYYWEYVRRYGKQPTQNIFVEFLEFPQECNNANGDIFNGWHDKGYLRVCMANLWEKHHYGRGSSRITEAEWARQLEGYREITGEEYQI